MNKSIPTPAWLKPRQKVFNHLPLWTVRDFQATYYSFSLGTFGGGVHLTLTRLLFPPLQSAWSPSPFFLPNGPGSTQRSCRMYQSPEVLTVPTLFWTLMQKGVRHSPCPLGSYRLIFKQWVQGQFSWLRAQQNAVGGGAPIWLEVLESPWRRSAEWSWGNGLKSCRNKELLYPPHLHSSHLTFPPFLFLRIPFLLGGTLWD